MIFQKNFCIVSLLALIIIVLLLYGTACTKEYSYERRETQQDTTGASDTTLVHDTTGRPPVSFLFCSACYSMAPIANAQWNFNNNGSFLCGNLTNAIMNSEKNAFTFFGPSACSSDTGLIITAYFEAEAFVTDAFNKTTNRVHFEYYDNTIESDLLESNMTYQFSLTIDSFLYQTRVAKGRFSGFVVTRDGKITYINDGKFNLKFRL